MFDLISDLQGYSWLILLLAGVGLIMASAFEQMQMLAKYFGAERGFVALGYNNAMKLMVGNRLGAVLYFFFMALAIDTLVEASSLKMFLAGAVVVIGLSNIALLVYFRKAQTRIAVTKFSNNQNDSAQGSMTVAIYGAYLATTFNLVGLTLPMIWSATYPELRLTLANTGFLFNSIFTVINVFIVESRIANLIDDRSAIMMSLMERIFLARLLAALSAIPVILLV